MCNEAMRNNLAVFFLFLIVLELKKYVLRELHNVPDHFKTQEMCDKAVTFNPYTLRFVPDHFKAQEMCDAAVREDLIL